jgi:hypothetical protein
MNREDKRRERAYKIWEDEGRPKGATKTIGVERRNSTRRPSGKPTR